VFERLKFDRDGKKNEKVFIEMKEKGEIQIKNCIISSSISPTSKLPGLFLLVTSGEAHMEKCDLHQISLIGKEAGVVEVGGTAKVERSRPG
jgi:hypothetical protein